MKTKLVSALGLALLAASLTFSSSFACSQSSETKAFVLPTVAPESDPTVTARTSTEEVDLPADVSAIEPPPIAESAPVIHSVDAIVVEITQSGTIMAPEAIDASEAAQTSITEEVDQPATVINAIEPSPIDESAPVIHSADAIVVEITQSVTIVAPEAIAAPETDATVAVQAGTEGSIAALDGPAPVISAIEPSPNDASTPSAIQSADAIVVEITQSVTVAAPGQKSEDNEEVEHTGSTSPEHAATEPASIPDTETLALDGVN
jgi:F0F1-type ATP synthase epsilon subunit